MKNLRGVVLGVLSRKDEMAQDMRRFVLGFFLTLLVLTTARGQEFSGVRGVVLDKSSAPIAAVDVALDNEKAGIHFKTTTNDIG